MSEAFLAQLPSANPDVAGSYQLKVDYELV